MPEPFSVFHSDLRNSSRSSNNSVLSKFGFTKQVLSALCDKLVSTKKPVSQIKENQEKNFYSIFSQLLQLFPQSLIRNQICCQEKKTPKSPLWLSPAEHTQLSLQVFGIPAISYKVEIEWHYLRPKENHSPTLTLPPEEFGEGRFLRLNVSI
jgi:hypothetical protein